MDYKRFTNFWFKGIQYSESTWIGEIDWGVVVHVLLHGYACLVHKKAHSGWAAFWAYSNRGSHYKPWASCMSKTENK